MTFASAIHDPLAINLRRQTDLLLSSIPKNTPHYDGLNSASTVRQVLATISSLLAVPAFTQLVATLFRPILLDLCARWLEVEDNGEEHLVALCYLVEVHEELFPILNQLLLKYYEDGPLSFVTETPSLISIDITRLQRLLLTYYRILQANRELPRHLLWSLAPLSKLIWTPYLDNGARLLAIRCYSLQSGMGEEERCKLECEILGEPCGVDCQLNYGQNADGTEKDVDGWIMPVVELRRVQEERNEIVTKAIDYFSREETDATPSIELGDLSTFIVSVHGVLHLRSSPTPFIDSDLVTTPSSVKALQQLALHLSLRLPTLLTSAPSAGKALLLSHLATLIHPKKSNQVVTIHLADTSLDPRSLLGSYVSSTLHPGTFEWKEGVLVRCMQEGKWVVFEDVDRGSNEVLGVIKPLVESLNLGKWIGGRASLDVPSRGRVVAHEQFMLFATRSLLPSRNGTFHPPSFFGSHKFAEVIIQAPSTEELRLILDAKFERLAGGVAQAIINMWESVKKLSSPASSRDIGLRELQKFCQRLDKLLPASHRPMDVTSDDGRTPTFADILKNPTLREDMYLEARDVFFGAGTLTTATRTHARAIAEIIGEHLGLDADRQLWVLQGKSPEFDIEKDSNGRALAVRIGATRLPARLSKTPISSTPARPFAMHKPAVSLLSRIANAISHSEPVLLTGETGTGKTSVITHLASLLHHPLISLNLSHQTESSDLLGGLKPIDARIPGSALQEQFLALFGATFSRRKNEKFEIEVRKAVNECKWKRAVGLWKESVRFAMERIQARQMEEDRSHKLDDETPRKRRKTERAESNSSASAWSAFLRKVEEFEVQHVHGKGKFAFGFVEGPLVKALRSGDWILLDEVNLASPETLECITGLLHGPTASITLTEHGSLEPVPRHPDFRLFACMNPATDVGKKDLPPNIRSRFTEIDVPPPDSDKDTLLSIISQYIGHIAVGDRRIIMDIAEFYMAVKHIAESRKIADGANHRPHFSMRTLTRALTFAADIASSYSLRRAVWEGCLMAFTMVLDAQSAEIVTKLAHKHLTGAVRNISSMLAKEPPPPTQGSFVKFGPFYLEKGPLEEDLAEDYVLTPSVERKLIDLSRIILTRRFPVLIEGPTSSGKTSSIEFLAKRTSHRFVRINNHEHTDIQEYLGSYVSDPLTGKLVFRDGLLVQALRYGHWIVLDELNLAPTDVLEALNRLLDDNRELVIPETQEIVRPHPHFMLFATQNPPGLYAGRKILSRAFRNRFLEVHFEDVPQSELQTILCQRCRIAPSYGKRIVSVFHELQKRRQTGRVFESKHGFATLRDLFRWAGRDAIGYQELADNGYMLLAERTRRPEDKVVVKEVIESVMGVRIDEDAMYDLQRPGIDVKALLGHSIPTSSKAIWTKAMQRLYTLVCRGLKFNEPILLVGETGSGKTSVCQVFADASFQRLVTLNCHQNTETADLIGGLRPVRNRSTLQADIIQETTLALNELGVVNFSPTVDVLGATLTSILKTHTLDQHSRIHLEKLSQRLLQLNSIFEWHDGPLIEAMYHGDVFLLDEISLADDSVLERLNSVLEPGRSVVLAERGGADSEKTFINASEDFKLIATMNPGGDYGKKELSPALRNRFTEIWVPPVDDRHDLELIVNSLWQHEPLQSYTPHVLNFVEWLCIRVGDHSLMSLRDILAWVVFINSAYRPEETDGILPDELFHHAAHMTYMDGLSSLPQLAGYSREVLNRLKADALKKLHDLVPLFEPLGSAVPAYNPAEFVQLGSFAIDKGSRNPSRQSFNFTAPTTLNNAMRVIRACQVPKPILLEGSPGVGKTSLITALANLSGHELCRINLSDQTDLIDLFGSDLPVEGGAPGEFAWKDAEFLRALQEGHWVLLDEMNLAPQAVLEGLNAVLDHRGTVYIPELNRSFKRHPSFRVFAAQNPLYQGGGRKGLPKSFVNRFTKVYIEELTPEDLYTVCSQIFPDIEESTLRAMISFNIQLNEQVSIHRLFAQDGSPWEFNLRDVIRWGTLTSAPTSPHRPHDFLQSVYLHRFRVPQDRRSARAIFDKAFSTTSHELEGSSAWTVSTSEVHFGHFSTIRRNIAPLSRPCRILKMQLSSLESLGDCVSQSWLAIVTGPRDSGKTGVVRTLADFTGNVLWEVSVNSATDTMDILGSFEQIDTRRRLAVLLDETIRLLELDLCSIPGSKIAFDYQSQARALREDCKKTSAHNLPNLLLNTSTLVSTLIVSESNSKADYQEIHVEASRLLYLTSGAGQFEWVDGPLIKAMKAGQWIMLDGANLCSPSVLDRLNSLCESDGSLTLSERGFVDGHVQLIKPHQNFRLFMSVDPRYGELSRAMRNRGIEIALMAIPLADDLSILRDHHRLPLSSPSCCPDLNAEGAIFDAARRGLLGPGLVKNNTVSSTGHCLDQDSVLVNLVDRAPSLLFPSLPMEVAPSWIFFLTRSLSPSCMPYVRRYMDSLSDRESSLTITRDFLNTFPRQDLTAALESYKQVYAKDKHASMAHILAQPMYFYWSEGMGVEHRASLGIEPFTPHSMVLEILNLSASIFIFEHDNSFANVDEKRSLGEKDRKAREAVVTILQEIRRIALQILRTSSASAPNFLSVRLASTILSFTNHLKMAFSSSSYDFSALYAVSSWLLTALENCPPTFMDLLEHVRVLRNSVSLSTGLGLFAIWSKLFLRESSQIIQETVESTERLASSLGDSPNLSALRHQAFSVICLESLPSILESQKTDSLFDLRATLDKCLRAHSEETNCDDLGLVDCHSIILELSILALCKNPFSTLVMNTAIQEIITLTSQEKKSSLVRIVPLQHLVWAVDAGNDEASLFARAQIRWLEGIWKTKLESANLAGPSIIFHPISLHRVIITCDMTRIQLQSLVNHERTIRQQARLAIIESGQTANRMTQLVRVLYQTLSIIASCFSSSYDTTVYEAIQTATFNDEDDLSQSLSEILLLLQQSSDDAFVDSMRREMNPLFDLVPSRLPVPLMGLAWLGIGRVLLDLVVPDTPVDPAGVQNCNYHRMQRDEMDLSTQIRLHQQLELLITGNTSNDVTTYLTPLLQQIRTHLAACPRLPHRHDVSRLHLFWSEVVQFQGNVLPSAKLEGLLNALHQGNENAYLRERVIQESLAGFYQRLDTVYPEFSDIIVPLKLAILYIQFGLRIVVESTASLRSNTSTAHLATSLLAFPSANSSSRIIDGFKNVAPSGTTIFQHILLALAALSASSSLGLQIEEDLSSIDMAYEQAVRLWLIDRAKKKQLDEESSTLYRHSKTDCNALSDAEMEEQDFLALFPTFEDALETELPLGNPDRRSSSLLVQSQDMTSLLHAHHALMDLQRNSSLNDAVFLEFRQIRHATIQALLTDTPETLPETLDRMGIHFQFSLLRDNLMALDTTRKSANTPYNFYADANYQELKRGASVVATLRQRLQVISDEWPDQMVLKHLIERCDVILSINSTTPVAKILSMVEQLLVQTEDWEMYANRENSIKVQREELIRLVVDWRRLELSCWKNLLDAEAASFTNELSEWWFRLYDALVRGPLAAADQELEGNEQPLRQYLESLIPLLDDFVSSSPLGQFHPRLRLIQSFERYLALMSPLKTSTQCSTLQRVGRILNATCAYYALFSDPLRKRLMDQKAALETEVKGFIKLASWKDVNVQALKQSAQRTHLQLYKIVRKFRDVLRQPVSERLQPQLAGDIECQSLLMDRCDSSNLSVSLPQESSPRRKEPLATPSHIFNLPKTFGRYDALIGKKLRPIIQKRSAQIVDDVSVEIITTSKSLASIVIPSGDRREKHQKALLVRKRKALADLLKELKHAGLPSNVKPDLLRQNTDQLWIREQPIMPKVSSLDINVDKGDAYFIKLCGFLPSLRASLPNHHPDLTTRELQRGEMYLESGFAIAVDLRCRLATALAIHQQMVCTFRRLRDLSSCEDPVYAGPNVQARISSITKLHIKVSHALSEVINNAVVLNQLGLDPPIPDTFFDEVSGIINATDELQCHLKLLQDDVSATVLPVLKNTEHGLLLHAEKHLSQTYAVIFDWKKQQPRLNHLFLPLQQWLDEQKLTPLVSLEKATGPQSITSQDFLNSLLVCIQTLVSRCPDVVDDDRDEEPEKYILKGYQLTREFTHLLNLGNINSHLERLLLDLSSRDDFKETLRRIIPFLELYLALARDQLVSHNNWTKSIFKLDFVLCSVLQTLSQQGFCKPADGDDDEGGGEANDATGGVGIGEGSGTENVSKEIEDESQIEGLQGDDAESKEPESQHDDGDAIEMNDDFGGGLEDVPDAGSENDANSDTDSEPDFDETLGDLDDLDLSAVDEKMWGDEKGPEDAGDTGERADKDHSKGQASSSEVVARESEEQKQSKEQMEDEKPEENAEIEDEARAEEGENEDSSDLNVSGAPMDEHVQEANTLDLPDDMDLGGDDADKEGMDMESDGEMEEEYSKEQMEDEARDGDELDDFAMNEPSHDVSQAEDIPEGPDDKDDEANARAEADAGKDEKDEVPREGVIAQPDVSKGDGMADSNEVANPEPGENVSTGEAGTSQGGSGQASASQEKVPDDEGSAEVPQPSETEPADSNVSGSAAAGAQQGQMPSQSEMQPAPNPLRSLGDALQEIRQRFEEILNADSQDAPQEKVGESSTQSQIEYLRPEDADHDMQALGPAGDEQVAKLDQLMLIDEDRKADDAPVAMDVDTPLAPENRDPVRQQQTQPEDLTGMDHRDGVEGAILQTARHLSEDSKVQPGDASDRIREDETMEDEGQNAELQLRAWRTADYPEDGAERIWRLYETLTHELAYTLCEQLRLILEPTLATRLKGDYRTGKRLNMKKVISYIASDYTKDKIWLRRTKPSQREYQVLISIDDSRSMAESHSIHLAYQTLALISKALSRLESGDIAIAKFGETVDLLHGFDEGPFTDQAGTKVVNAFRFTQKATDVLSLLNTSLKVLENARERKAMSSASASDLWQLQIIISDGMCQNHEELRTVLRKAEEQRVMIVFIILDSLQTATTDPGASGGKNHGSILSMQKVEYKEIGGKMDVQMRHYLDSFPFEYYVVLRNVEALPEVLAGTLKQFFERISEE